MAAILRGESRERPGGVSLSGATYRRRFIVKTTSVYDGPFQVVRAEGLPGMLAPYETPNESDNTAFVIDKQAVPRESPKEWFCDVDYGPVPEDIISGGGANPLNRAPTFGGGLAQFTKQRTRDWQGKTITNSAGDPYGPQEWPDSKPELEITTVSASFSLVVLDYYKDALNLDPFLVYPPGTLKMQHVGFRTMQESGIVFAEVTWHMLFSRNWWLELLDEGFYTFPGVPFKRERIAIPDAVGGRLVYPTEPQLLNGDGDLLEEGQDPKYRAWHMDQRAYFWPILQGGTPQTGFLAAGSQFGMFTPGQRTFPGVT